MFICIFHLHNSDLWNYVGPFDSYNEADRFRNQWEHRTNVKKVAIERVDKPLTPEECRMPVRWSELMGPAKSSIKAA